MTVTRQPPVGSGERGPAALPQPGAASPDSHPEDAPRLRMRDLCEQTGLSRQAIHFYIREGLLPPGHKTARNMAWYTPGHVERLLLIKRLQRERFLPLHAIKALLDERDEGFDDAQRDFLRRLRARLQLDDVTDTRVPFARVDELVDAGRVDRDDIDRLYAAGLAGLGTDDAGRLVISGDALAVVEVLSALRALGFTEDAGIHAEDVLVYQRAVHDLLRQEARIVARAFQSSSPDDAARRIRDALPLVHELISRLHRARIQEFLAAF
ncbi:MAG: MerR family transcriptional regulator [Deltaproteobacteria bacterium]|nr:MAG: MerR family transcriptional regulator [Deltaproteobacteria bacterium]